MQKLITILILITALFVQAKDYGKAPANFDDCLKGYAQDMFDLNPRLAADLGLTPEMGYTYKKDGLGALTIRENRAYELAHKYNNLLRQYDRSKLKPSQQLFLDIMLYSLEQDFASEKYQWHSYLITPLSGFHLTLNSLFSVKQPFEKTADVNDYMTRFNKFATALPQIKAEIAEQSEMKIIPPVYIIDTYLEMLNGFAATKAADNALTTGFNAEIADCKFLSESEKEKYRKEFLEVLEKTIYPQYTQMIQLITEIKGKADDRAGAWKLPDGEQYYKDALLANDINMPPADIFNLGIKETKRIQAEVLKICAAHGFKEGKNFGEIETAMYKYLKTVPGMRYEQNDSVGKTILNDYQKIIDKIYTRLPEVFSNLPKAKVKVETIPAYKGNALGAYYESPSIDGKRPGVFFTNASGGNKYGMRDLAIHEAIPGHHLQIALGLENHNKPMAFNFMNFTAFTEGWALYCERLGMEQGWYESDYELFGYYMSELFRAVRLVVDTGIHYKKWSREDAAQYMKENLGWAAYSELNRYILWPGQACAYKIGEQKILELREKAKKELGNKFDIRDFHTAVLKNGAVPLKMLERQVDDYISSSNKIIDGH